MGQYKVWENDVIFFFFRVEVNIRCFATRVSTPRQLGELRSPVEAPRFRQVQSPSALTRRIKDHEEARNFALICLKVRAEFGGIASRWRFSHGGTPSHHPFHR